MKNRAGVVVGLVVCGFVLWSSGCSKCAWPKKGLTSESIASAMAPVICDKYSECSPAEGFQKEQCLQEVSTGIGGQLKAVAELKVDQPTLDNCLKALRESTCEALNSPTPPEGCSFLQ